MRLVVHPNIVALKAFFYSQGDAKVCFNKGMGSDGECVNRHLVSFTNSFTNV